METPIPPGSGEQDREVPACCLLSLEVLPSTHELGMGLGVLSQVECFETGSGEFLHTTNLVKDSKSLTLEPENISHRESSKIPNFCLGSRKHSKGKEGESLYVSVQCKKVGFSLTTQLSGSYFYDGKTHSK